MPRDIVKVSVGSQHSEIVTETELSKQRVDRTDLNSSAAAFVPQFGRVYMVKPVGNQQRQRGEAIEDLCSVPRSREALQKLLQNQPGREDFLAGFDRADEFPRLLRQNTRIAPESQRPDAGVDKEAQWRERSAL